MPGSCLFLFVTAIGVSLGACVVRQVRTPSGTTIDFRLLSKLELCTDVMTSPALIDDCSGSESQLQGYEQHAAVAAAAAVTPHNSEIVDEQEQVMCLHCCGKGTVCSRCIRFTCRKFLQLRA